MGTKRTVESIQKQIETHTGFKHSTKSIEKMRKSQSTTKAINRKKDNRAKQKFPTKDTELEKAGQKILRENNIEFTDHKAILGQPDIFIEPNFCIFMDGDQIYIASNKGDVNTIGAVEHEFRIKPQQLQPKYDKNFLLFIF